ncbi:hypothetical protein GXW82_04175 [Streptacidiphilus sp. 4-A2]|nr:hypothetical protein [Streptacidiphilus sp. 4-A2]
MRRRSRPCTPRCAPARRRTPLQAISLAELAETQLALGHLDQACDSWSSFLELYPDPQRARTGCGYCAPGCARTPATGLPRPCTSAGRLRADARSRTRAHWVKVA